MKITHNKINDAISDMESLVSKGQPFAKRNKERKIRAVLRNMKSEQSKIILKDIWCYIKLWIKKAPND